MSSNLTGLLAGKKALVTGGSRGLGRSLCHAFTKHGAETAFTWHTNESAAQETVALCAVTGPAPIHFRASVLDATAIDATVRELEKSWGGIDILVNNAGVSQNLPLALMEESDWDFVMDTNVKGAFLMSRAVLRGMFRRKAGVILNLGSLAGTRMIEAPIHYYTSKAAIKGFTEALAKEVARHNVRVLCLAPGLLEDGVGRNLPDHKRDDYLRHCALGRVGTFAEVAEFAAFLVSDQNSYQNGATVVMDGCV
ncbi:MAG: beta-ketoacyl-ACP reductase [Verrucomicrobia bacterium]|nr:MAG: beta-ketoacyl-ACP reductase [Verrucomicrobiota bacterium]